MKEFNQWDVPFSTIRWFEDTIQVHSKVASVKRENDIFFTIVTDDSRVFKVLLLNEYKLGLATLLKALDEFPKAEYIIVGGDWNGYTWEAKEYGLDNGIGIFKFSEFMGAINTENPKSYEKAKRGNEKKRSDRGA